MAKINQKKPALTRVQKPRREKTQRPAASGRGDVTQGKPVVASIARVVGY